MTTGEETKLEWLCGAMREVKDTLHGTGDSMGLVGKVQILWRCYVWILCALSGGAGSLVTFLVMRAVGG